MLRRGKTCTEEGDDIILNQGFCSKLCLGIETFSDSTVTTLSQGKRCHKEQTG